MPTHDERRYQGYEAEDLVHRHRATCGESDQADQETSSPASVTGTTDPEPLEAETDTVPEPLEAETDSVPEPAPDEGAQGRKPR